MKKTQEEYLSVVSKCKNLFMKKNHDYGTSWRIMRLPSITDQIFIKAQRIRSIQEKGVQLVEDSINEEFVAIVNYCVIALLQLKLVSETELNINTAQLEELYDEEVNLTLNLLLQKNHDYGEAWRDMRVSSITDIILMKIFRLKQIEDNQGKTLVSEGVDANYRDIMNYAVFSLIKLEYIQ
ncbi:MAG: DUF1599 domain-containing protein [Cytophagales bacterium]